MGEPCKVFIWLYVTVTVIDAKVQLALLLLCSAITPVLVGEQTACLLDITKQGRCGMIARRQIARCVCASYLIQIERLKMRQLGGPELDETVLAGSDQSPRAVVKGVDALLVRPQSFFEPSKYIGRQCCIGCKQSVCFLVVHARCRCDVQNSRPPERYKFSVPCRVLDQFIDYPPSTSERL